MWGVQRPDHLPGQVTEGGGEGEELDSVPAQEQPEHREEEPCGTGESCGNLSKNFGKI